MGIAVLDAEQAERFKELYQAGYAASEIGLEFGVHRNTVNRWARSMQLSRFSVKRGLKIRRNGDDDEDRRPLSPWSALPPMGFKVQPARERPRDRGRRWWQII